MRKVIFGIIILVSGIGLGLVLPPLISGDNLYDQLKKYEFIFNTAYKNYVEPVDAQKLTEAAIKGMLNELDVHSVYIPAEQMQKVDEDFEGSFDGIGVEFEIINDTITVISPLSGGPSDEAGIISNDKIIKVNGEDVIGIEQSEVPKKLKGPKGTFVEIDVKRAGETDLLHFKVMRDKIPNHSILTYFVINGTNIGYVLIERFAQTTHQELVNAVTELKSQGMKRLILDLRGNPGGLFDQAVDIADEFVPRGDTIVFTKGRRPDDIAYSLSTNRGSLESVPVIALIDEGSASASEIVSGCLQDLDRGLVVGETSYGKGLVQRQYKPGDGSAFRVTIAKYYTPSGRCIQRPYKDKVKYRNFEGRFDLDEGENIDHTFDRFKKMFKDKDNEVEINDDYVIVKRYAQTKKSKNKTLEIDSLPVYKTRNGRPVLGGGGITPDYIIKNDTITKLTRDIRNKNLWVEFIDNFMAGNGKELRNKYHGNFSSFIKSFKIAESMLSDFRTFAESKGIKWNDPEYKLDRDYMEVILKANIARSLWDRSKYLEVYYNYDKLVNKSVKLFPAAEKLANLR